MNSKYFLFGGFILMVFAQLYVPSKMILDKEKTISEGTLFRFKTAPIDPSDPFRGKYVRLNFDLQEIEKDSIEEWDYKEKGYATFEQDDQGLAVVKQISKIAPTDTKNYILAEIYKRKKSGVQQLQVSLPFDRLYMEESKALPAEKAFFESRRDSSKLTYALVYIYEGDYVLTDVMIDGWSLKTLAESRIAAEE